MVEFRDGAEDDYESVGKKEKRRGGRTVVPLEDTFGETDAWGWGGGHGVWEGKMGRFQGIEGNPILGWSKGNLRKGFAEQWLWATDRRNNDQK